MNFSLIEKPKLNKDLILSKLSEEQIFSFYIGSEIRSKKLFRSKLRNDKNPTCSMYRNKFGTLIYKDFATGQHLNCFAYVMEMFKCDYYTAIKIIANDFNIIHDSSIIKNKGKIISKDFRIEEKWWAKYGITPEILKRYDVYSCKHVFLNGQLIAKSQQHCPIFGYYGKKYQGNELWKIYFPKRKEYRFIGNYPSKKMQGYEQLPKTGKVCVITKSQKDCMSLYSLGIPACAPNSETVIPNEAIINDLKSRFKYIICLWDNDYTGISFLNKFKHKYPDLIYTWIPRSLKVKDISDYYKEYGKKETIKLIKEFFIWLKINRQN